MVIYILCPYNITTGGIELIHQMCHVINSYTDIVCKIWYTSIENLTMDNLVIDAEAPSVYSEYKVKHVCDYFEIDKEENVVIIPEGLTFFVSLLEKARKIIWWMSVDNYIKFSNEEDIENIADHVYMHLYQSYYAKDYVQKHIKNANGMFVSDYINDQHRKTCNKSIERKNIALFNPAKGYDKIQPLIAKANWITWSPLCNLSRDEMIEIMRKSKIYIDFGNHPGKDRIPREAAANGCCVITNRKGAAAFTQDLPIPEKYKFADTDIQLEEIDNLMRDICENFEEHSSDFEEYRSFIKKEKDKFISDVISFVNNMKSIP